MKIQYLLSGILVLSLSSGCSLFKKTSKNTVKDTYTLNKAAEVNLLNLRTAGKETQTYSYWTDSTFYKYELIKEKVDEARVAQEKTNEKQSAVHKQTVKERKTTMDWVYPGIVIGGLILACFVLCKRITK